MIDLTLRGNQPIAEYYLNDDSVITKLESRIMTAAAEKLILSPLRFVWQSAKWKA